MSRLDSFAERYGGAALITGASSGLGEQFARQLAAARMDLVLVARRGDRLRALADELGSANGITAIAFAADLAQPGAAADILANTKAAGIHVGLLINNAGIGQFGPFAELDGDADLRQVDVNCRAPVALTHAYVPAMLERGRGGIIVVSSVAGFQPAPFYAVYSATKAFDLIFAEALWAELSPKGIDVLALCPGYTPTEFQAIAGSDKAPKRASQSTAADVVKAGLLALGRQPSVVPGGMNKVMTFSSRLLPRRAVARLAYRYSDPSRRKSP